jgi:hypothetical protein
MVKSHYVFQILEFQGNAQVVNQVTKLHLWLSLIRIDTLYITDGVNLTVLTQNKFLEEIKLLSLKEIVKFGKVAKTRHLKSV